MVKLFKTVEPNPMVIELDKKTELVVKKKGYSVEFKMNEGPHGFVYRGSNGIGGTVAVKVGSLDLLGEKFKQKFLPKEVVALKSFKHDNVIQIYDLIRANNRIYIFMEFANESDITAYLIKNGPVPEDLACEWFTQVSNALRFVHDELRIAHRDIKTENILLHNKVAKLTDFVFAEECWDAATSQPTLSETFPTAEPYHSPQITAHKPYNPFAADVWAMGVLLFAMLNNKFPFHVADCNYTKLRFIKKFPADLTKLQEKIFDVDDNTRITMAQVLEHPWILRKGK